MRGFNASFTLPPNRTNNLQAFITHKNTVFSILLLDTNASFSATFANLLRHSGYHVEIAQNEAEAVALHATDLFDLILLSLPNAESIHTVLQRLPHRKAILLLPADGDAYTRLLHIPDGVPIFCRPFRTEEALAAIYAVLTNEGVPDERSQSIYSSAVRQHVGRFTRFKRPSIFNHSPEAILGIEIDFALSFT